MFHCPVRTRKLWGFHFIYTSERETSTIRTSSLYGIRWFRWKDILTNYADLHIVLCAMTSFWGQHVFTSWQLQQISFFSLAMRSNFELTVLVLFLKLWRDSHIFKKRGLEDHNSHIPHTYCIYYLSPLKFSLPFALKFPLRSLWSPLNYVCHSLWSTYSHNETKFSSHIILRILYVAYMKIKKLVYFMWSIVYEKVQFPFFTTFII